MAEKEIAHIAEGDLVNMGEFLAYSWPAVGMGCVEEAPQTMSHIAVWPVEACLLEFLHDHFPLNLEGLGSERKREHAVAFHPEGCLDIGCRHHGIEIGEIV